MPGENIEHEVEQIGTQNNENQMEINDISISSLTGRVCYFSLAGDLALNAFSNIKFSTFTKEKRRTKLKNEFTQRLYLAILMFDKIVMHCSDPLRNEIVLEILEDHIEWIKAGHIVFIFSDHIANIREDYKKYIDDKIRDYSEGFCSEKEAISLKQGHINTKYYERVITLLENTRFLVRKPDRHIYSFDKLVINDLDSQTQTEKIIIDSYARLSQILSLNLSLHQLLHIRHLKCNEDEENEGGKFVFPQDIVHDVIGSIRECLEQGNTIARSAIVDSLEEKMKNNKILITEVHKNVLKAITLRMDILYCKMNSGEQLILEFHPLYEVRSNYQIDCFIAYLKNIANKKKSVSLTKKVTNSILQDEAINSFRLGFLNCMADMREYLELEQFNRNNFSLYNEKVLELFSMVLARNQKMINIESMGSIANILREEI